MSQYSNRYLSDNKANLTYVDASIITRDTTITVHTNELLVHDTSLRITVKQYPDPSTGITDASGNIGDIMVIDTSIFFKQRDGTNLWVSWTSEEASLGY